LPPATPESFIFPSPIKELKTKKTTVLSVVLYESENLSRPLMEENRLRIFENRVIKRIFGSKRETLKRGLRKLNNEELHNLYSSLNIIR
jgi:hypothetical protein